MAPLQAVYRGLRIVGLVLFYYVFSIGITFYNKWLMKVRTRITCFCLSHLKATNAGFLLSEITFVFKSDFFLSVNFYSEPLIIPLFLPGLPLSPLHDFSAHHYHLLAFGHHS